VSCLAKLQPIGVGIALIMTLDGGVSSATCAYVEREVVLTYFTNKEQNEDFRIDFQCSDWLELSENIEHGPLA
jgi:hypothetical protein